ncbi:MAG TPA: hypothetical protein VEI50_08215 [Nitrospiraceae bacterium]|nr:hypothetical protein [Nitrospiraceae bacterium]
MRTHELCVHAGQNGSPAEASRTARISATSSEYFTVRAGAAAKLGMKLNTLQSKMQKLGIFRPS